MNGKLSTRALIFPVIVVVVFLVSLVISQNWRTIVPSSAVNTPTPTASALVETPTHYQYNGEDGKTALELLQEQVSNVTVTTSDYGDYVSSIAGVEGGMDGKYWTYYINGEMAAVGAGEYVTKVADLIEWKFE